MTKTPPHSMFVGLVQTSLLGAVCLVPTQGLADASQTQRGVLQSHLGHGNELLTEDGDLINTGSIITTSPNDSAILFNGDDGYQENIGYVVTRATLSFGMETNGDGNSLINSGFIDTSGADALGVGAHGDGNVVYNSGEVTTSGDHGFGVEGHGHDNSVTNTGSILTEGVGAYGLGVEGDRNVMTNSGDITTAGLHASGIYIEGSDNTVSNTGTISIDADMSAGIFNRGNTNAVSNTGQISTNETLSHGIDSAGDGNRIVNAGTLTTNGDNAHGFYGSHHGQMFENKGTITTRGNNSYGISVSGNGHRLTNSGTIISTNASAIYTDGTSNTVILNAGSALTGNVTFAQTDNTLQFGAGLNTSFTLGDAVPDTIIADGGLYAIDGSTVHVVDGTGFTAIERGLDDLGTAVLDAVARHQTVAPSNGSMAWAGVLGGVSDADATSTTAAFQTAFSGLVGGYSLGNSTEVFFGYGISSQDIKDSFEADTNALFAGLQRGWTTGKVGIEASLIAGRGDTDQTRTITTSATTLEQTTGAFTSTFISPAVTLRADIEHGPNTVIPSLRLRYAKIMQNGFQESGTAASAVTVADRTSDIVELRLQLEQRLNEKAVETGTLATRLRTGIEAQVTTGDAFDVTLAGSGMSYDGGADTIVGRAFVGIDVTRQGPAGSAFSAGFEAGGASDNTFDVSAGINWSLKF